MEVPVWSRASSRSAGTQYRTVPAQFKPPYPLILRDPNTNLFVYFESHFCALFYNSYLTVLLSLVDIRLLTICPETALECDERSGFHTCACMCGI